MPTFQELPPKGGYPEPIQWKRNLPSRGFRPSIFFWGIMGICTFGFYKLIGGIRERNELVRERNWSRFYITPLLEAEADRDNYRRVLAMRERERQIMADVPGFDPDAAVYNDPKFRNPTISPKY